MFPASNSESSKPTYGASWSATRLQSLAPSLDHIGATVHTSLVGATMLANCFVRRRQRFAVVDAAPQEPHDELSNPAGLDRLNEGSRTPPVGAGQVQVRLHASSLNYHDYLVVA